MNLRLETTDENMYYDFIEKYIKENKKHTYKIKQYGEKEKNGQLWYYIEVENIDIKIK